MTGHRSLEDLHAVTVEIPGSLNCEKWLGETRSLHRLDLCDRRSETYLFSPLFS